MKNKSHNDSPKKQKAKYSKINLVSCIVAVITILSLEIFNILSQIFHLSIQLRLGIIIPLTVIGLTSIIPMFISWFKLRELKKQIQEDDADKNNTGNPQ